MAQQNDLGTGIVPVLLRYTINNNLETVDNFLNIDQRKLTHADTPESITGGTSTTREETGVKV